MICLFFLDSESFAPWKGSRSPLNHQADTERVVKIQRKIESRFANYNEMKESKGKRDRANQEIFLHEKSISMAELPSKELNQEWLKHHSPSVKKNSRGKKIAISNFHKKDMSTTKFLHKWEFDQKNFIIEILLIRKLYSYFCWLTCEIYDEKVRSK